MDLDTLMHPSLSGLSTHIAPISKHISMPMYQNVKKKTLLEEQYDDFMRIVNPIGKYTYDGIKTVFSWIKIPERKEPFSLTSPHNAPSPFIPQSMRIPIYKQIASFIYNIFSNVPPHHIFFFLSFLYILYLIYIKIKYPFWNIQPVYHSYDIKPRIKRIPYLVYDGLFLPKTKYNDNHFVMGTYDYENISQEYFSLILDLLKCHYIPNENVYFNLNRKQLDAYHQGQNEHSYLTFYSELEYSNTDSSFSSISPSSTKGLLDGYREIAQGMITSRPMNLYLWNSNIEDFVLWQSNYIDFLCVHRENNRKTRNLFQTHISNIYSKSPNIKSSIFKKEVDLCPGVVPLVQYKTYTFGLEKQKQPSLPSGFSIIQIKNENLDILANTLKFIDMRTGYSGASGSGTHTNAILVFGIGYYLSLIRNNIAHIYCLIQQDIVYGIYILRETHIEYDTENEPISSIQLTSLQNIKNNELFYLGYLNILKEFSKTFSHKVIVVENIGSNTILVERILKYKTPLGITETAYYTHNLIIPGTPFLGENIIYLM